MGIEDINPVEKIEPAETNEGIAESLRSIIGSVNGKIDEFVQERNKSMGEWSPALTATFLIGGVAYEIANCGGIEASANIVADHLEHLGHLLHNLNPFHEPHQVGFSIPADQSGIPYNSQSSAFRIKAD